MELKRGIKIVLPPASPRLAAPARRAVVRLEMGRAFFRCLAPAQYPRPFLYRHPARPGPSARRRRKAGACRAVVVEARHLAIPKERLAVVVEDDVAADVVVLADDGDALGAVAAAAVAIKSVDAKGTERRPPDGGSLTSSMSDVRAGIVRQTAGPGAPRKQAGVHS